MRAGGGPFAMAVALLLAAYASPTLASSSPASPSPPAGGHQVALTVESVAGLHPGDAFAGGTVRKADARLHLVVLDVGSTDDAHPGKHGIRTRDEDPKLHLANGFLDANDPLLPDQYAPQLVNAPQAWAETLGGTAASVCIVDTGVRSTHQALAGDWAGGWNIITNSSDYQDDDGHGTHVAGIAAAGVNDSIGTAGMASVPIYAAKVLDSNGNGSFSDVALGIVWCADHAGPRTVISMSLGGPGSTVFAPVSDAVAYAASKGDLLVAAAGNGGCLNCIDYPATLPGVIAVTCTDSADHLCSFSSRGSKAEIAAPGSLILSSWDSSDSAYAFLSGTSMSTPLVSGAAALYWNANPNATAAQVRARLDATAHDLGAVGRDSSYGYGRIDVACLLDDALCPPPPPPPPPPPTPRACDDAGPDAFGYLCQGEDVSFQDISATGHRLTMTDEKVASVPIGFSAVAYGKAFTTAFVSSNGWLSFLPATNASAGGDAALPSLTAPRSLLAGYWGDLDPGIGGTVAYQTIGAAPARTFIVQFTNVPDKAGGTQSFQMALHEGSDLEEVAYRSVQGPGPHVTGIQDATGTRGLTYDVGSFNDTGGLGVRFFRPKADLKVAAAPVSAWAGNLTALGWTVSNLGPDDSLPGNLTGTLPLALVTDPASLPAGCSRTLTVLRCPLPAIPHGQSWAFQVNATPSLITRFSTSLKAATIANDPVATNNAASLLLTATRPSADVQVLAAVSDAAPHVGDTIAYNVTFHNAGPGAAIAMRLRAIVPTTFGIVDSTLPAGCTLASATLTCSRSWLDPGQDVTAQVHLLVKSATHTTLVATATTSSLDATTIDHRATALVAPVPAV